MELEGFKIRAINTIGETDTNMYLDAFMKKFNDDLNINGQNNVAYFFPKDVLYWLELNLETEILIGCYNSNGTYSPLVGGDPVNGRVLDFTFNGQQIQAAMFPYYAINTYIGGLADTFPTATDLANFLGLAPSEILMYNVNGSNIECCITNGYEIPTEGFYENTDITYFIDDAGFCAKIGTDAFWDCNNLENVRFVGATTIYRNAFRNCGNLESAEFGNKLITINQNAFDGCSSLTSFTARKCETIGDYAFRNCGDLNTIAITEVIEIGVNAFENNISLGSITIANCTYLGDYSFYGCTSLQAVDITSITGLNEYTFFGCSSLTQIVISNLESIGDSCFQDCTALQSMLMGNVIFISSYSFAGCDHLKTIVAPKAEIIGVSAFDGCVMLEHLTFANLYAAEDFSFKDCTGLQSFTANFCEYIGSYAFQNCTSLVSITLPSLYELYNYAFSGCSALTSAIIENCQNIGEYAFSGLTSLIRLNLQNARYINEYAFSGCTSLKDLVSVLQVLEVQAGAFFNCESLPIFRWDSLQYIGDFGFRNCTSMSGNIEIANCTVIGQLGFGNTAITDVKGGLVNTLNTRAFADCADLVTIDMRNMLTLGEYVFENCTRLPELEFGILTDAGNSAFASWANGTKSITVPTAMDSNVGVLNAASAGATIYYV